MKRSLIKHEDIHSLHPASKHRYVNQWWNNKQICTTSSASYWDVSWNIPVSRRSQCSRTGYSFLFFFINCILIHQNHVLVLIIFFSLWFQVHLTQGDHNGRGMIISWVTPLNLDGSNVVTYWIASNVSDIKRRKKKASTSSYKFYDYSSGFLHHATIKNLEVCVLCIT